MLVYTMAHLELEHLVMIFYSCEIWWLKHDIKLSFGVSSRGEYCILAKETLPYTRLHSCSSYIKVIKDFAT